MNKLRDSLLISALEFTNALKGKARDRALFDYLCGACMALHATDPDNNAVCPPWLWVIGCRGGSRLNEIENMIHAE